MGEGTNMASSTKATGEIVTKSRFFSNHFNTAIIDGPLRIYFTDRQESQALQVYFEIQETLKQRGVYLNSIALSSPNTFVMLYPNSESFSEIFSSKSGVGEDRFGEHFVLGINLESPAIDNLGLIGQRVSTTLTP